MCKQIVDVNDIIFNNEMQYGVTSKQLSALDDRDQILYFVLKQRRNN